MQSIQAIFHASNTLVDLDSLRRLPLVVEGELRLKAAVGFLLLTSLKEASTTFDKLLVLILVTAVECLIVARHKVGTATAAVAAISVMGQDLHMWRHLLWLIVTSGLRLLVIDLHI